MNALLDRFFAWIETWADRLFEMAWDSANEGEPPVKWNTQESPKEKFAMPSNGEIQTFERVNLGSWIHPIAGMWNVDIVWWSGVNEVVNLNNLPWPWATGRWHHVRAVDIVEHLGKLTKVEIVAELARVVAPGGTVEVRVPCASHPWALASLQHAHAFQYNSFEPSYAQPWFNLKSVRVQFTDGGRSFPLNRATRFLCKYTSLIHTLTFCLEKK